MKHSLIWLIQIHPGVVPDLPSKQEDSPSDIAKDVWLEGITCLNITWIDTYLSIDYLGIEAV